MPRFRLAFGAVLGAAATLVAMVGVPAAADASTVSIYSAGPTSGDPGVLTVIAVDGNNLQLTNMTVHIYSGSTDEYDVTDMAFVSGPAGFQTWTATAPIPQADLAPGTYTMTVDATDADETDTGIPAPDPLAFVYTTTITATAAPSVISYGDTGVTISGRLTGITPGGGSSTPVDLGGVPVDLYDLSSGVTTQIATTQPNGTYTGQVQLASTDDQYNVQVQSSPTIGSSGVALPVTWSADATKVSVKVSPEDFTYGSTAEATMTGTASYKNGTTWLPLQNFSIYVSVGSTEQYVTTNAAGGFTWTFPPSDGTLWNVLVGGGNQLDQSQADGYIHVAVPLTFKSFSASLSSSAVLSVSGCVATTAPGFSPPQGHMNIQYSAGPRGPWKYLGRVSLTNGSTSACEVNARSSFKGSVPVRLAGAYYRAQYPATPDYQAAVSGAVHRQKYVTRIATLKVSPGKVRKGGKITVSGRLEQYNGKWRDFGKQRILIILRPKGSKVWYWIHKVTASSSGHFSVTFTDPTSATWSAQYDGNKTHFAGTGATHYVSVSAARATRAPLTLLPFPLHELNPGQQPPAPGGPASLR